MKVKKEILDPVEELGTALCLLWNRQQKRAKYSYDAKTQTVISDTGTGFDFKKHLHDVAIQL